MIENLWEAAVVARLKADAALVSATQGIYAGKAPQAVDSGEPSAFPYLLIKDVIADDDSDARSTGYEITTRIHTYSRSRGRKQANEIRGLLRSALHRRESALSVPGHTVLFIDRTSSEIGEPNDLEGSWEGVCQFRALVKQIAPDY